MRIYTLALSGLLLLGGAVKSQAFELRASQQYGSDIGKEFSLSQPQSEAETCVQDQHYGCDERQSHRVSGRKKQDSTDQQQSKAFQQLLAEDSGSDDSAHRGSGRKDQDSTDPQPQLKAFQQLLAEDSGSDDSAHRGSGRKDQESTAESAQAKAFQQLLAEDSESDDSAHRGSGRKDQDSIGDQSQAKASSGGKNQQLLVAQAQDETNSGDGNSDGDTQESHRGSGRKDA
jgi:hypothetical protein